MPRVSINFASGFAPDVAQFDLTALRECSETIPSDRGMMSAPLGRTISGFATLPADCRGAASVQKLDGTFRLLAGTQTKLYESALWTDVSAGGSYTGSSTSRWMFAQFGDITLATDGVADIQQSSSGAFAAVANAPKARIVITVPNFAVAFNTKDGTASTAFGDSPDRWWCCAYQDPTDWAIDAVTQCVSERLIGSGGPITAAAPFGTGWVAYKARDMFHAYYSGDAAVFTTQRVPGNWGCVGQEAVADIGNAHFVVGPDDIFLYDGARPVSVATGKLRNWFFNGELNKQYQSTVIVQYSRATGHVWVFYPGGFSTVPDRAIVYHLPTGRWGASKAAHSGPGASPGVINAAHIFRRPNAADVLSVFVQGTPLTVDGSRDLSAVQSVLTTGMFGDNEQETMLTRAQLMRSYRAPLAASEAAVVSAQDVTVQRSAYQFPSFSPVSAAIRDDGTADFRSTAAWHSVKWTLWRDFEATGCEAYIQPAGGRAS